MSPIVFAVPYVPPVIPPNPWRGVSMRWEAPDGSVWPFDGARDRGVRMLAGVRGLTDVPREQFVDETAGVEGGRWRGQRATTRECFWPVAVWRDEDSAAWLEYDAAWRRALDPEEPGRWVVTHPDGTERHLLARYVSDGDPAWDDAPGMRAWARYGIRLLAVDPYWRGELVHRSWDGAAGTVRDFVRGASDHLRISKGTAIDSAVVENPGDVDAHPVWWVQDVTSVDLSVGGRVIEVPAVAEDKLLVVDSSPTALSAIQITAPPAGLSPEERLVWVEERLPTGTDRTAALGAGTTWGAIPRRATTTLGIDMNGTGLIDVLFTPRYRAAW